MQSNGEFSDERLLCSKCFCDPGLRWMAGQLVGVSGICPNCGSKSASVLSRDQLLSLTHTFFVRGSIHRTNYGAAPVIQFNEVNAGSLVLGGSIDADVKLLQRTLGIGLFLYGPRLWMIGEITPLRQLQNDGERPAVIERILTKYPVLELETGAEFYRVRKAPVHPEDAKEYDAPPAMQAGFGRLSTPERAVLYGSQDLQICVHECRFAAEDELYVATLTPRRHLRLLDLSAVLQENGTEFESLDLAVHMLFLAGQHAYPITRAIATAAAEQGFDGVVYTSYFSLLRTGRMPFETAYGLSLRRFGDAGYEHSKTVSNLALFGHPVAAGDIELVGVNRLVINQVAYGLSFGPIPS